MVSERFAKGLEMKSYMSIRFNDESLNRHPFYQKGHDAHSLHTDTYIYIEKWIGFASELCKDNFHTQF